MTKIRYRKTNNDMTYANDESYLDIFENSFGKLKLKMKFFYQDLSIQIHRFVFRFRRSNSTSYLHI